MCCEIYIVVYAAQGGVGLTPLPHFSQTSSVKTEFMSEKLELSNGLEIAGKFINRIMIVKSKGEENLPKQNCLGTSLYVLMLIKTTNFKLLRI